GVGKLIRCEIVANHGDEQIVQGQLVRGLSTRALRWRQMSQALHRIREPIGLSLCGAVFRAVDAGGGHDALPRSVRLNCRWAPLIVSSSSSERRSIFARIRARIEFAC